MKLGFVTALFLGVVTAAGGVDDHSSPWDYKKDGKDWPEANVADNECGGRN